MSLLFECSCGTTFREDKYHTYATYRDVTNAHRERCTKTSRATEGEAVALEQTAEPRATAPRSVRQAADATSTPASAANQLADRIRGGFILFVACPTLVVALVASGVRGWL